MDTDTLNEILDFIQADFRANEKLPASSQRVVFHGYQVSTKISCVIKLSAITPINIGRIQRDIRVLEGLDSEYFPSFSYQNFIMGSPCTPRFAAPEQLTNMKSDVTYKTDQLAIGVIAFFILTDQFPYGDFCEIGEQLLMNLSQNQMGDIRQDNNSVNERLIQFIVYRKAASGSSQQTFSKNRHNFS